MWFAQFLCGFLGNRSCAGRAAPRGRHDDVVCQIHMWHIRVHSIGTEVIAGIVAQQRAKEQTQSNSDVMPYTWIWRKGFYGIQLIWF